MWSIQSGNVKYWVLVSMNISKHDNSHSESDVFGLHVIYTQFLLRAGFESQPGEESWTRGKKWVELQLWPTKMLIKVTQHQLCGNGLDIWKATRSRLGWFAKYVGGWCQAGRETLQIFSATRKDLISATTSRSWKCTLMLAQLHTHSPQLGVQLLLAVLVLLGLLCYQLNQLCRLLGLYEKHSKRRKISCVLCCIE